METKDILTLGVALLAFVVSAISTTITIIRGQREKQRAIRNEITNVLSQIVETALDKARLFHESNEKPSEYYFVASSILSQRNNFLLNQAVYLSDQVPHLINAVEYNTLGHAHVEAGELMLAERYYKKAIVTSRDRFYKSVAQRSYALFLFQQQRFDDARRNFEQAIALLPSRGSHFCYQKGTTYQMWAGNELSMSGDIDQAKYLVACAAREFGGIENFQMRENALKALREGIKLPPPEPQQVSTQA